MYPTMLVFVFLMCSFLTNLPSCACDQVLPKKMRATIFNVPELETNLVQWDELPESILFVAGNSEETIETLSQHLPRDREYEPPPLPPPPVTGPEGTGGT